MIFDDDEIKAAESRLRQQGWDRPSDEQTPEARTLKKLRKVHKPEKPKGLLDLGSDVKSAGVWLATNLQTARRPFRPFIASRFGLSFDDAGRAVAEASRLVGREL